MKSGTSASGKGCSLRTVIPCSEVDRELSGDLPIAATSCLLDQRSYIITNHYGKYAVEGLRNVSWTIKCIDIQENQGAGACVIFNSKVVVFKLNGLFNILIRHGAYISRMCATWLPLQ